MNWFAPSSSKFAIELFGWALIESGKHHNVQVPFAFASASCGSHMNCRWTLWALTPLDSSMVYRRLDVCPTVRVSVLACTRFRCILYHLLLLLHKGQPLRLCFKWSMWTNFAVSSVKYAADIQPLTMVPNPSIILHIINPSCFTTRTEDCNDTPFGVLAFMLGKV